MAASWHSDRGDIARGGNDLEVLSAPVAGASGEGRGDVMTRLPKLQSRTKEGDHRRDVWLLYWKNSGFSSGTGALYNSKY